MKVTAEQLQTALSMISGIKPESYQWWESSQLLGFDIDQPTVDDIRKRISEIIFKAVVDGVKTTSKRK